jgi:hypothetical protein
LATTRADALALISKFTRDCGPVPELGPAAIARLLAVILSDPSISDVDNVAATPAEHAFGLVAIRVRKRS